MSSFRITQGFTDAERPIVAALFWEDFGAKLSIGLSPEAKALKFLAHVAEPRFTRVMPMGPFWGVVGFKTSKGAVILMTSTQCSVQWVPYGALHYCHCWNAI